MTGEPTSRLIQPRAEVLSVPPAIHGALDYNELQQQKLSPVDVIDFSENSNPFGPSPAVHAAMTATDPARYPDRESLTLRAELAEQLGAAPDEILVGNGAAELLWLIAFTYVERADRVLILGPTFGEYARVARLMGANVLEWQADESIEFAVDVAATARQIEQVQPKLIFLCNPNNPTGTIIDPAAVAAWAKAAPTTLFVIDEAYRAFAPGLTSLCGWRLPNLLVVHSLTKEYALAGLRLGYVAGPPSLITPLRGAAIPWSVNAVAQAAGAAALADPAHLQQTLTALQVAKGTLVQDLHLLGLSPLPSQTHFLLLNVGNGAALRQQLLAHRLVVRDCASFGLPAYVRIATRRPAENEQLLAALRELKAAAAQ